MPQSVGMAIYGSWLPMGMPAGVRAMTEDIMDHLTFPIFECEDDAGCGSLEGSWYGGGFNLAIDQPFAGDSETGIGQALSIRLSKPDAKRLAEWILSRD